MDDSLYAAVRKLSPRGERASPRDEERVEEMLLACRSIAKASVRLRDRESAANVRRICTEALGPAAFRQRSDVVTQLLDLGADARAQTLSGFTPLHDAVCSRLWHPGGGRRDNASQTVLAILTHPSVVAHRAELLREKTFFGRTALHLAAIEGDADLVALLMMFGAPPCARDREGRTAAALAEHAGHIECAELCRPLFERRQRHAASSDSVDCVDCGAV